MYLSFHATIFSVPLGWMRGSSQLLAHDLGELLQRDLDLEQVIAGAIAGLARARLLLAAWPSESPTSPSPCPTPPCCLSPC